MATAAALGGAAALDYRSIRRGGGGAIGVERFAEPRLRGLQTNGFKCSPDTMGPFDRMVRELEPRDARAAPGLDGVGAEAQPVDQADDGAAGVVWTKRRRSPPGR